ncbi:unnamed protein product [Victoria cruziana]
MQLSQRSRSFSTQQEKPSLNQS